MVVLEGAHFRSAVHFPHVNKLSPILVISKKVTMKQNIKETLAETIELDFQATNTGVKCASFQFL